MKKEVRNHTICPVAYTVNIVGDPWSLLIARDIVFYGKKTYSDFLSSGEHITTSMLADKLVSLENEGLVAKVAHTSDRRKTIYSLTNKGLDLFIPLLVDMANWGVVHNPRIRPNSTWAKQATTNKTRLVTLVRETVVNGGSVLGDTRQADYPTPFRPIKVL